MQAVRSSKKLKTSRRRWAGWVVGAMILVFLIGMLFSNLPNRTKMASSGPQFRKEGTLQFVNSIGQTLQHIDIEIADDDLTRAQGLMWRRSMEENQGMLFMMQTEEQQSFWMRNTYLSLDIIFVNEQLQIVTIRPNTKPQSLDPVTSDQAARYVVEVNAGFCQRHGIREGDRIAFQQQ